MPAQAGTIIYITRDIERAMGMAPGKTPGGDYYIITNAGEYAREIKKKYPKNAFLIESAEPLDTYALLSHPETEKIIASIGGNASATNASILVFKNTSRIEDFCAEKKWKLINPSAALAEKIENKITQVEWLGPAVRYLPPHEIKKISDIRVEKPSVVQWAHGHTGGGTILVPSGPKGEKILAGLKGKFPEREARVTDYISGPMFTVNIVAGRTGDGAETAKIGNISYQITGMLPFTDNPFATVGNDWSLPHSVLSETNIAQLHDIARSVGEKMLASGWRGLFGIDCIYDEGRDNVHLIEINARQPASASYESRLQEKFRSHIGGSDMTVFEAHIAALTGQASRPIVEINDGAQIVDRIQDRVQAAKMPGDIADIEAIAEKLRQKNYTVIRYDNKKPGADLLRIQSDRGIMEQHNKFNSRGKEILGTISGDDGSVL